MRQKKSKINLFFLKYDIILYDFAVKLRIPFKDYGETCVKLGHLRNEIA